MHRNLGGSFGSLFAMRYQTNYSLLLQIESGATPADSSAATVTTTAAAATTTAAAAAVPASSA